MSITTKCILASFVVVASMSAGHAKLADASQDRRSMLVDKADIQVAQTFRGQILRSGGRGLPPNPCRSRCSR